MKQAKETDWPSMLVGTMVPMLAALTSPWISLPVALVTMLVLSLYYRRRPGYGAGAPLALLGAAVIAAAMVYLWARSHR